MKKYPLFHVGLFEGVGGFGLASKWNGIETIATCDINEFGNTVTAYHLQEAYKHRDVRTLTKEILDERLISRYGAGWQDRTILTAGFPCQPFSVAGRRAGADDDRYLWPETLRIIAEVRPSWVIGENVAGILSMVQSVSVVEMESGTDAFGEVYDTYTERSEFVAERICQDLEGVGYSVIPFVIPACAVGAPHRRDRIWFVAHSDSVGGGELLDTGAAARSQERDELFTSSLAIPNWINFPTVSPLCSGDDGLSLELVGISLPTWRRESITAMGNAVVPQIPQMIINLIKKIENDETRRHRTSCKAERRARGCRRSVEGTRY
ncbi:DNA cytosine methyltransferase [Porphyromonas gingivalis]|uniref:DNA cytosine methyltransferase n=1 Tax=Porphyromonas gingivalis TaxID=837 RepID=UPI00097D7C65|nr:DNA cytosine methyltransferase [Porphyromonas gingivalis]